MSFALLVRSNWSIDTDAHVQPCACAHSRRVRRSFSRYTCARSGFAPHRMSSEWSQCPRLAFLAALWRLPLASRALALHRSMFEAAAPLVNVVTRAFVLPVRKAIETSWVADDGR